METKDIIKELALNILDELETKEEPMKKEVSLADGLVPKESNGTIEAVAETAEVETEDDESEDEDEDEENYDIFESDDSKHCIKVPEGTTKATIVFE